MSQAHTARTQRKPKFLIVFLKELRETIRDPRALGLLALFIALSPVLIGFALNMLIDRSSRPEREGIEVTVIGATQAPNLMALLKTRNVTVTNIERMSEEQIGDVLHTRKAVAVLRLPDSFGKNYQDMRPAPIELWFDSAQDTSGKRREVELMLAEYSSNIAGARLLAHGVSPAVLNPIQLQKYDAGTAASRSALIIGTMLGTFFIPAFALSLSASIDSTAGERERRSLEILLAQPARALDLITGKWLAASTLAAVGITLELLCAHGVLSWLPLEEIGISWRISTGEILMVSLLSVPLSLFAAALQMALAMNARSFKEAQTVLSFVLMIPMIPMILVPMLGLKTGDWMYFVPVLANQTLLGELAKGQGITMLTAFATFFSSLIPALLAVAFGAWRMKSEHYVLSV
jgi:sodium transport system permease protein